MTDHPKTSRLYARKALAEIATALADTRVVMVVGPRQAGKTTLVSEFATPERPYVTLDAPQVLQAARNDPTGFIRGLPSAVIDEIQRVPDLMLAIKQQVDQHPEPGSYLLTGSANVMTLPAIGDSLAGRLSITTLLPLAQSEIASSAGTFIDQVFSGVLPPLKTEATTGEDLRTCVLRGGYPEALQRSSDARRMTWHTDYLSLILDRDVRDIANIEQLDKLPRLMRVLAEHAGQLLNTLSLATALELSAPTMQRYISILERLYLVRRIGPWHSNKLSRLIKSPKLHFLDSGLLASLRNETSASLKKDNARFGSLLETFCLAEILKLASWSSTRVSVSHFRTKEQDEVDIVLEDRMGRIVGIEIKASATAWPKDFSGLRKLREAAGDRFLRGLVLHDTDHITPFSENLHSAPVSVLWTM